MSNFETHVTSTETAGMKQDGSITLFRYWNRLRGSRAAPRRTEIEPAEIKALLADTFILERNHQGVPSFRLAGTRLCATYGQELKGHSFLSLWAKEDQEMAGRLVACALEEQAVVAIHFEGASRDGRHNDFELVILPLDAGQENPRGLGTVQPVTRPYWLGADPIVENRMETFRLVNPEGEPMGRASHIYAPPLSPAADLPGHALKDHGRRIRHLVVLPGGRR